MKNTVMKYRVLLVSRDGDEAVIHPEITFSCNPKDYGNGYYIGIKCGDDAPADYYDYRYDKRLNPDDLEGFVDIFLHDLWTGKGHWSIKSIEPKKGEITW